jgi:hypothetical protein
MEHPAHSPYLAASGNIWGSPFWST